MAHTTDTIMKMASLFAIGLVGNYDYLCDGAILSMFGLKAQ